MPDPHTKTSAGRSEARDRLLSTASGLSYAEGINNVGVDRIVSAADTTLARPRDDARLSKTVRYAMVAALLK